MLTCGVHTIHPCCQEKFMLACSSMSSLANHGSSYFGAKTSSLTPINFWLPHDKACGEKLGCLQTDSGRKFISTALKSFCNEKGITIGYVAPYMHKENGIAERCWRILATMKNLPLIDSGLPVNFWAEVIDTANYLRNRLLTRREGPSFISKEAWTNTRQNLGHIGIFGSRVSTFIPCKKRTKSDVRRTWKGIFISYTRTSKHLRVWARRIHQVLIASKPIVNKSKRGADLLLEHLLLPSDKPLRLQTGKQKPRGHPRKNSVEKRSTAKTSKKDHVEDILSEQSVKKEAAEAIMQTKQMRIHHPRNPKPKTDLGGISGKTPLGDRLVRPAYKFAKWVTETSSKVHEPKTYNEAINDPIHGNRWREAVDEELWNLDTHQI